MQVSNNTVQTLLFLPMNYPQILILKRPRYNLIRWIVFVFQSHKNFYFNYNLCFWNVNLLSIDWINTIVHLLCCSDVHSTSLIAPIEDASVVNGTKTNHNHFENTSSIMLNKHWGSTHNVQVYREANKSLGISIVGGKVSTVFNIVGVRGWIPQAWKCHSGCVWVYLLQIDLVRFSGSFIWWGKWNTDGDSIYIIMTFMHRFTCTLILNQLNKNVV